MVTPSFVTGLVAFIVVSSVPQYSISSEYVVSPEAESYDAYLHTWQSLPIISHAVNVQAIIINDIM